VADIGLNTASDTQIIEYARQEGRGILTLDADFHALLAISGASNPSVLRVRKEGLRGEELATLVQEVLEWVGLDWTRGVLVTVNDAAIRLHRLPVLPQ